MLVVGGSAAGLSAALQLVRQRRTVIVVDAGEPRNAPASHMHGFLGRDGTPPTDLVIAGREEVRSYGGEVLDGRVHEVVRGDDATFRATLVGGHTIVAQRLVVATGLVDDLPDIIGLAQRWGSSVIHCPFCHGYEVRDRRIVQVVTHPMALHPTRLLHRLTADLTIVIASGVVIDPDELSLLERAGVTVRHGDVAAVESTHDGAADDEITAVLLADGTRVPCEVVMVGPRFRARLGPFAPLGLRTVEHQSGLGDVVEASATGMTAVPGVYAAGNVTDPSQQVVHAAANGNWVGAMVAFDLADADLHDGCTAANEVDWDHRYSGDQLWSGNPNGALVAEVAGMRPGRALDVGAGEGGDAVWLATQGWSVTANDISSRALGRIAAEAERRGLAIELLHGDANAVGLVGADRFDLVTAHYASIPRTPDQRVVAAMVGAVAPGGTLLVVSHDIAPMRHPVDTTITSRIFDPDAYVRVDDVAAALRDDPDWIIETHVTRARPAGAASHHADDIVFRARRLR